MKVVTPFRPFPPESGAHLRLGAFDWLAAIEMLRTSVRLSCDCETYTITDFDADVPGPRHQFVTHERRLMIWLLEVSLAYLSSEAFDQDTVFVSPDALVVKDLRHLFKADLGLMVRTSPKYEKRPLLNAVQAWRHASRGRLVGFYERVLDLARTLPNNIQRWGADTVPLVQLLEPLRERLFMRNGLTIWGHPAGLEFRAVSTLELERLRKGRKPAPVGSIVDFKGPRKLAMRAYFDALDLEQVKA